MRYLTTSLLLFVMLISAAAQDSLNVVILGDSNTWIGGDDCSKPRGWNYWFAQFFGPASCRSYARSGATWTHTARTIADTEENVEVLADNNVIYNQIMRLASETIDGTQPSPQLILIMAGTNDAWFKGKRPEVFSQEAADVFTTDNDSGITLKEPNEIRSLAMAVRYDVELLQSAFPDAQIVLITPLQSTAFPLEDLERASTIIEACGHQLGCSVIRMDKGGCIGQASERRKHRYTTDGTHTSEAGAQRTGRYITNQLITILE